MRLSRLRRFPLNAPLLTVLVALSPALATQAQAQTSRPGLQWSTFVGGTDDDRVQDMVIGPGGDIFLCGTTYSSNLKVTAGVLQTKFVGRTVGNGKGDAFVARLSADGKRLIYLTYLGGSSGDEGTSIDVDSKGIVTVGLTTYSTNLPTTANGYKTKRGTSSENLSFDGYIARLSADGKTLLYGSYFGADNGRFSRYHDKISDVTYDEQKGWIYLSGTSHASGSVWGMNTNSFQTINKNQSPFIVIADIKKDPKKTTIHYASYVGGTAAFVGRHHVDAQGVVTLSGITYKYDQPVTSDAWQKTATGKNPGWVARLDPSKAGAKGLIYATWFSGITALSDFQAMPDGKGKLVIAGGWIGTTLPTTANAFQKTYGGPYQDAFLARLDLSKTGAAQLDYATYLGGKNGFPKETITALHADGDRVTLLGSSGAREFPTTTGAFQRPRQKCCGNRYAWLARFDLSKSGARSLPYCTAIQGCSDSPEEADVLVLDPTGNTVWVAGTTRGVLPIYQSASQAKPAGKQDGFVLKLDIRPVPSTDRVFGTSCKGSKGTPVLTPQLDAQLCLPFRFNVSGAPASSVAIVFLGFSNKAWGALPLPLKLDPFGMTGCTLYTGGDVITGRPTSAAGTMSHGFTIPNIPLLVGNSIYHQVLLLDKAANKMGLTATNALESELRW